MNIGTRKAIVERRYHSSLAYNGNSMLGGSFDGDPMVLNIAPEPDFLSYTYPSILVDNSVDNSVDDATDDATDNSVDTTRTRYLQLFERYLTVFSRLPLLGYFSEPSQFTTPQEPPTIGPSHPRSSAISSRRNMGFQYLPHITLSVQTPREVAYVPYQGDNIEDTCVLNESFRRIMYGMTSYRPGPELRVSGESTENLGITSIPQFLAWRDPREQRDSFKPFKRFVVTRSIKRFVAEPADIKKQFKSQFRKDNERKRRELGRISRSRFFDRRNFRHHFSRKIKRR